MKAKNVAIKNLAAENPSWKVTQLNQFIFSFN